MKKTLLATAIAVLVLLTPASAQDEVDPIDTVAGTVTTLTATADELLDGDGEGEVVPEIEHPNGTVESLSSQIFRQMPNDTVDPTWVIQPTVAGIYQIVYNATATTGTLVNNTVTQILRVMPDVPDSIIVPDPDLDLPDIDLPDLTLPPVNVTVPPPPVPTIDIPNSTVVGDPVPILVLVLDQYGNVANYTGTLNVTGPGINETYNITQGLADFEIVFPETGNATLTIVADFGASFTLGPILVAEAPNPPRGLSAAYANGTIRLDWLPPTPNGLPIVAYNVYRDGDLYAVLDAFMTHFIDGDVEAGRSYTYTMTASNPHGEGPHSNEATANTPTTGGGTIREEPTGWVAPVALGGLAAVGAGVAVMASGVTRFIGGAAGAVMTAFLIWVLV